MNMLKSDLIKQIKRYQNYITSADPSENDTPKVLHYIRKLAKLPIKLAELEETGVGKTINSLRKRNGGVGEEATSLVAKWKSIVKKQVAEEERGEEEEEKEDEQKRKNSKKESQSNHVSERNSCSDEVQRASKCKVKKEENEITSEQKLDVKTTHLITLKSKNKRKHSDQSDNEEKKKVKRIHEKSIMESGPSQVQSKNDSVDVSPVKPKIESNISDDADSDLEKNRRKRSNEDKKHKKGHEKRHKTSRHNHKSDRHHRHHSKNSQQDKKRDDENGETSQKRHDEDSHHRKDSRHDKDSKSKSKSESKKHHKKPESDKKNSSLIESKTNEKKSRNTDVVSIENHVDSTTDDFGAALLNIPHTSSPAKKRSTSSKSSTYQESLHSPSSQKSITNFDMFSTNVSLEPLDFGDDLKDSDFYLSPNSISQTKVTPHHQMKSDEAMLNSMVVTKNQKTRVYSGNKSSITNVPTLFDLCVRLLQENFDALEFTGGVPYHLLKPILEKVSVQQLYTFENYNPYLIGETDDLWKHHAKKDFRKAERLEYETWRDLYLRCVEEREERLVALTENISQSIANSAPVRKTQLAYVNSYVKPPRNVARSQAKHGTGGSIVQKSPNVSSPTASQSVKERLAKEAMAPNAIVVPTKSNLLVKKKKAPLMLKSLQLMKGLKR